MKAAVLGIVSVFLLAGTCAAAQMYGHLETDSLPAYLRDRGEGISVSMFGTFVQKRQFIVYPFFEYYRDHNLEYSPEDFGRTGGGSFLGKYAAFEGILFLSYGFTDRFAIEVEGAIIRATLDKSADDHGTLPAQLEESGLGDAEGQLRWRWTKETEHRPELYSYFETVIPTQNEGSLIGTTNWEFSLGVGALRGFSWGTLGARAALEYAVESEEFSFGEGAIEYLRRLSPHWRICGAVEGNQDDASLIAEVQWHMSPHAFLKLNNGIGLTSKSTDYAPEVGVLFSF
jgi:hypothetical protein